MSEPTPLFVGLDVLKDSIAVAHAHGQSADPPVLVGDSDKLVRRLQAKTPDQTVPREGRVSDADAADRLCDCGATNAPPRRRALPHDE